MDREEFTTIQGQPTRPAHPGLTITVNGAAFGDVPHRTLLLGADTNGHQWHVYCRYTLVHRLISDGDRIVDHSTGHLSADHPPQWSPAELVPDAVVYPDRTDATFAWALHHAGGITVPWAPFDEAAYELFRDGRAPAPTEDDLW